MVGDVLISLPAELVDALEAKQVERQMDGRLIGPVTMTAMAELAIGDEADWKRVLESGRLTPVHHGEEPRQARTTVRCDREGCCPGMCRHPMYWRGKTRCACSPERTGR